MVNNSKQNVGFLFNNQNLSPAQLQLYWLLFDLVFLESVVKLISNFMKSCVRFSN